MPDFSYIAVDKTGQIQRGVIEAPGISQVRKVLGAKDLELVSCEEKKADQAGLNLDVGDTFRRIFFGKITSLEKISFAQHLGIMLKTGVPIIEGVEALASESASPKFKVLIKELASSLERGKSISFFLEEKNFFSPGHLAILKSGEATGKVTESLALIARDLKRDYHLQKKIRSAMAYPIIITAALIATSGFIVIFVLPKVGEVFTQMNLKMPLPTKILLAAGGFVSHYFKELVIVLALIIGVFTLFFKMSNLVSSFFLEMLGLIPIVRKIIKQIGTARFIRSLGSLLASGVPISESLDIASGAFASQRYQNIIKKISEKVKQGVSLTEAFKLHNKYFGEVLIKMCAVGEKSGRLAEIFEELAEFYEEEVKDKLDNFATVIEPILMLLVGLGVGAMILSIVGPIYQMMGSLSS